VEPTIKIGSFIEEIIIHIIKKGEFIRTCLIELTSIAVSALNSPPLLNEHQFDHKIKKIVILSSITLDRFRVIYFALRLSLEEQLQFCFPSDLARAKL